MMIGINAASSIAFPPRTTNANELEQRVSRREQMRCYRTYALHRGRVSAAAAAFAPLSPIAAHSFPRLIS